MKAIIWNIRSIRSQKAFQRVQMLHKYHNFAFIGLLEPFQHTRVIDRYRSRIQMPWVFHNYSGKIWCFINQGFDAQVVMDTDQQITHQLKDHNNGNDFLITTVYVKYDRGQRHQLWDNLYSISDGFNIPWLVGRDFNVILYGAEKIGGMPVVSNDVEDFQNCIDSCELAQVQYKESPFT